MNQYLEYFTNYVLKNYDIEDDLIKSKYLHSLRVARLMALLSQKLSLTPDESILAFKIGLCHDLGRFKEVVRSGKFNNLTFDHGAYSNKVLYNDKFVSYIDLDINDHLLMRKAVFYHNKKDIPSDLTNREYLFVNMIRDMDKLDLLHIRSSKNHLQLEKEPTSEVIESFYADKTIDLKNIKSPTDSIILYLSFIKDLVFDASSEMAMKQGYFENLLQIIDVNEEKRELFACLKEKVKKRGKSYVR